MAVTQIISLTSVTLYLRYEYVEKDCLELTCFVSDVTISGTKLVKFDIVVTIIIIIGSFVHFCRILVRVHRHKWFDFQGRMNKIRVNYPSHHRRLMRRGFGEGYDFDMKRLRLNKAGYLMIKLEELEKMQDK